MLRIIDSCMLQFKGGGTHNTSPPSFMSDAIGVYCVKTVKFLTLNFRCPPIFSYWLRHCSLIERLSLVVGDDSHTGVVL